MNLPGGSLLRANTARGALPPPLREPAPGRPRGPRPRPPGALRGNPNADAAASAGAAHSGCAPSIDDAENAPEFESKKSGGPDGRPWGADETPALGADAACQRESSGCRNVHNITTVKPENDCDNANSVSRAVCNNRFVRRPNQPSQKRMSSGRNVYVRTHCETSETPATFRTPPSRNTRAKRTCVAAEMSTTNTRALGPKRLPLCHFNNSRFGIRGDKRAQRCRDRPARNAHHETNALAEWITQNLYSIRRIPFQMLMFELL